jgi:hypothetical protein
MKSDTADKVATVLKDFLKKRTLKAIKKRETKINAYITGNANSKNPDYEEPIIRIMDLSIGFINKDTGINIIIFSIHMNDALQGKGLFTDYLKFLKELETINSISITELGNRTLGRWLGVKQNFIVYGDGYPRKTNLIDKEELIHQHEYVLKNPTKVSVGGIINGKNNPEWALWQK